jgi:hypothetical protein
VSEKLPHEHGDQIVGCTIRTFVQRCLKSSRRVERPWKIREFEFCPSIRVRCSCAHSAVSYPSYVSLASGTRADKNLRDICFVEKQGAV